MNKVTQSSIEHLLQYDGENVVTIYIPTNRYPTPPNITEDQTRFKNLVEQGFAEWSESGVTYSEQLHQDILDLVNNLEFWRTTTEGLALFIDKDHYELYHLPIECTERVYVGPTYDVTPLLILKEIDQPYYVFALAVHNSKIFSGDMYGLEPVAIDFPTSPEDALNIDELFSNSNTIRGVSTQGGGNDMLSSHGQGDSNHAGQEEHLKYLRILDDMIKNSKELDPHFPIIIAGTDNEVSDFRGVSKASNLNEKHIAGNHTHSTLQDLHALAQKIIQETITFPNMHSIVERFNEQQGIDKAASDLTEILENTIQGRVDCLLISLLDTTADSVGDTRDDILSIRYPNQHDSDAVLSLVRLVIKQGGRIIGVDRSLLPDDILVAAIYRY